MAVTNVLIETVFSLKQIPPEGKLLPRLVLDTVVPQLTVNASRSCTANASY